VQLSHASHSEEKWNILDKELPKNFSMLEFGGGRHMVSVWAARKRPDGTVVSMQSDEDAINQMVYLRDGLNIRSMLVCAMPFDVPDAVALVANQPERFSYQLLPDLRELVVQQLPHEFEHLLGYMLSFAGTTFIPVPLPDVRFFSYWDSAERLVSAAALAYSGVAKMQFTVSGLQAHKLIQI
jgi:hypothetical protein